MKVDLIINQKNKSFICKSVDAKNLANARCNFSFLKCNVEYSQNNIPVSEQGYRNLIYGLVMNSNLKINIRNEN